MEPQTNRPHTYEESTMSFRETRHFDINFRETRSISTTFFSVPFLGRRPSLPSCPFIPSPLGASVGYRGTQSCAHRWKNVPPRHTSFPFLFPRTRRLLYTRISLPSPPQRTYPKLPGIDGPHEYPPLFSLFFPLPSISIGEKRTPDARPFVSFFHVSWKS